MSGSQGVPGRVELGSRGAGVVPDANSFIFGAEEFVHLINEPYRRQPVGYVWERTLVPTV